MPAFKKILVANRGEIAVRIIRACKEMGIQTVIAHSEADRDSLGVLLADESICIGPAPSDRSYLNIANVVSAAQITLADAIHPGYGFLSENAYLAEVCDEVGITFIGPSPASMRAFSDKVSARNLMKAAGVPVLPGTHETISSVDSALLAARQLGFPLMLKAAAGGGGRGMRVAHDADELARVFGVAQQEAQANFGQGGLYLERLIERGHHVEIQIAADCQGNMVHLGERECSVQRRHQKMIEESPSPLLEPARRAEMGRIACAGLASIGYTNVGTVEFLVDEDANFFFLEVNTRLQVEHPVTELVTGIDLVKLQISLAARQPLPFRQQDVAWNGHAIECRVTSEDPARGFAPDAGHVHTAHFPGGPWVRVDTHVFPGYTTPPYYDSLLAKVVVWGRDRSEAIARMRRAIDETQIGGVQTNLDFLALVLSHPRFEAGEIDINFVERHLAEMQPLNGQLSPLLLNAS
ncbi:MAG: acetyl-CoA carboxylase biotin carboxylase subunit [Chloroflexota bacterium]|nr:acetyl-CoA carboxylase biotin carboxylase subunit [Chloroflexota bacterium]